MVHSYACGDVAQLLGQAFLAEVDGAKHGSMCWFHNRPPGSAMTLRNSVSSAASHSNPISDVFLFESHLPETL